jgi:hypothetical protein
MGRIWVETDPAKANDGNWDARQVDLDNDGPLSPSTNGAGATGIFQWPNNTQR